jgi:hypothetical protein
MFEDDADSRKSIDRDIEALVMQAIGDSVTPSRLSKSKKMGPIRRLFGLRTVEGPFTTHLRGKEQPHYLFHSTSDLSFPKEEDEFGDDYLALRGTLIVSPVVGMITDQRTSFIYGREDNRRVVSMEHGDVVSVDYRNRKIEKEFILRSTQRRLSFGIWATDPYSSETEDAAAYIHDKSAAKDDYRGYDFDSDDFDAASEILRQQLREVQGLADEVDIKYVTRCGVKGARIGRYRSTYAALTGFLLGAGYGIWSDTSGKQGDVLREEEVDPETTAEVMSRWQEAGKLSEKKSMELAAGALGVAVSIDQQTSGRQLPPGLAEIDIGGVSKQLHAGNNREAGLQVASDVVGRYSTELENLIDGDFFEEMPEKS